MHSSEFQPRHETFMVGDLTPFHPATVTREERNIVVALDYPGVTFEIRYLRVFIISPTVNKKIDKQTDEVEQSTAWAAEYLTRPFKPMMEMILRDHLIQRDDRRLSTYLFPKHFILQARAEGFVSKITTMRVTNHEETAQMNPGVPLATLDSHKLWEQVPEFDLPSIKIMPNESETDRRKYSTPDKVATVYDQAFHSSGGTLIAPQIFCFTIGRSRQLRSRRTGTFRSNAKFVNCMGWSFIKVI
ncbi:hypothetical protein F5Y16DRAFT_406433 [Xylariaceae sp. FL0255]|nr:hypothetical protein F5Y16DRAFT_406433 [Xylariaceae sp. FL0255]